MMQNIIWSIKIITKIITTKYVQYMYGKKKQNNKT